MRWEVSKILEGYLQEIEQQESLIKQMLKALEDADNIIYTIKRMFLVNESHHQIKEYLNHQLEYLEEKYQENDILQQAKEIIK